MRDRTLRHELLQHFAYEAALLHADARHAAASGGGGGGGASHSAPLRVLSDIDDTLFAGWLDRRYPRRALYPGVLEVTTHRQRETTEMT